MNRFTNSQEICSIVINPTGDWIGFGCSRLGQLLVWEWQSETYVLKQQGHFNNMACLAYSPDGQHVVTGGEDGKVKGWNTSSGFRYGFHRLTESHQFDIPVLRDRIMLRELRLGS